MIKREAWIEIVRDFRVLYSCSAYDVGETISYEEGVLLVHALLRETTSLYTAKKMNFRRHFDLDSVPILDLIDLYMGANSKKGRKPKPVPKPYEKMPEKLGSAVSKEKFIGMMSAISSGRAKVRPLKR